MNNICIVCGKEFTSKMKAKYCSQNCKSKYWVEKHKKDDVMYYQKIHKKYYKKVEPRDKQCKICGSHFKGIGKGISCEKCKLEKEEKRDKIKKCKNCGKDISTNTHRGTVYCSAECRQEFYKSDEKTCVCIVCGKEFASKRERKYCSAECKTKHYKEIKLKKKNTQVKKECKENIKKIEIKKKKCKVCGSNFDAVGKRVTCKDCKLNKKYYKKVEPKIKTCLMCKKEFTSVWEAKYCSSECKNKYYREYKIKKEKVSSITTKICVVCNKEFLGNWKSKYCSSNCRMKDYFRKKKIEKTKSEPIKKCKNCGNVLPVERNRNMVYCSAQCRIEHNYIQKRVNKNREKIKICTVCGKTFKYHANEKVCSEQCKKERKKLYKRELRKKYGRNDRHYKRFKNTKRDWTITLKKLYEKDNGVCYICGEKCDFEDFKNVDGTVICGDMYPSIDHVIPASKGGTHTWDNVRLAHRKCNYVKNDDIVFVDDKGQLRIYL